MLEPESVPGVAHAAPTPARDFGPHALQILMTEHWSLLAARSLVYTEAMSRTSIFVAALTGSVVALALVAQATDFEAGFVAFALVLLPVVYFLGVVTIVRLAQVNREDLRWVQGMNRIRHAYLELAPELEPYFVTSRYDDDIGILQSSVDARVGGGWVRIMRRGSRRCRSRRLRGRGGHRWDRGHRARPRHGRRARSRRRVLPDLPGRLRCVGDADHRPLQDGNRFALPVASSRARILPPQSGISASL